MWLKYKKGPCKAPGCCPDGKDTHVARVQLRGGAFLVAGGEAVEVDDARAKGAIKDHPGSFAEGKEPTPPKTAPKTATSTKK